MIVPTRNRRYIQDEHIELRIGVHRANVPHDPLAAGDVLGDLDNSRPRRGPDPPDKHPRTPRHLVGAQHHPHPTADDQAREPLDRTPRTCEPTQARARAVAEALILRSACQDFGRAEKIIPLANI